VEARPKRIRWTKSFKVRPSRLMRRTRMIGCGNISRGAFYAAINRGEVPHIRLGAPDSDSAARLFSVPGEGGADPCCLMPVGTHFSRGASVSGRHREWVQERSQAG